jgi:hypothetical protein
MTNNPVLSSEVVTLNSLVDRYQHSGRNCILCHQGWSVLFYQPMLSILQSPSEVVICL